MKRLEEILQWTPIIGPRLKRLRAAEELLAKINPGHYYSVIPSAEEIAAEQKRQRPTEDSISGIALRSAQQLALLKSLARCLPDEPLALSTAGSTDRYHIDNSWFQETDATILHALLGHITPKRILEVGAGYSTFVVLDAIDRGALSLPKITIFEPEAERLQSRLKPRDLNRIRLENRQLQDAPSEAFDELSSGDILLVDSSHVSKCNSDVNRLFFEILPKLAAGVWVHLHDIYYPFRYPKYLSDRGQYWNEAYLLRAFLIGNASYEIMLWNDFICHLQDEAVVQCSSGRYQDIPASFWMRSV